MRRKSLGFFEEASTSDGINPEAMWPELRAALREPSRSQDLGLWRLAEDSARLARRRTTLLRPTRTLSLARRIGQTRRDGS